MARVCAALCLLFPPALPSVAHPTSAPVVVRAVANPWVTRLPRPAQTTTAKAPSPKTKGFRVLYLTELRPVYSETAGLEPATVSHRSARRVAKAAKKVQPAVTFRTLPQPWKALAWCEGGRDGSYKVSSDSYYRGWLQFDRASWRWVGGRDDPAASPLAEQLMRARRLLTLQGWRAWPVCSRELGLR